MSLAIIRAVASTEAEDALHMARLLILLRALAGKSLKPIDGIMKLAKLDFLLRYPACLEKAVKSVGREPRLAAVEEHERTSIESKMIRYRYGPWDARYRRWIAILYAKQLVTTSLEGKTVFIRLTPQGAAAADRLAAESSFDTMHSRAQLLRTAFGDRGGTWLRDFIYKTFPEIVEMRWGEEIVA